MKNTMGVGIRMISAIVFMLGIVTCIFSLKMGIIMIVLGVIGWNAGAKLLDAKTKDDISEDNNYSKEEKQKEVHNAVVYQPIDYSAVPYDLKSGLNSSDNRFQALTDISFMNEFLKEARKLCNIKEPLEICTEEILWEGQCVSKLERMPHTKTGKAPKYIVKLRFATRDSDEFEPLDNYFGDIYYMQDGTIGKAWLVCWKRKTMYAIDIGLVGTSLVIKKVETSSQKNPEKRVIYKR